MQALILGCLLCLQISNPCDSNQAQPFSQDPSCAKCLTDLRDHFQIAPSTQILTNATSPTILPPEPAQTEIQSGTNKILGELLADVEDISQRLKENPNEVYDLVNKIGTEIRQGLVPEIPTQGNKPAHLPNEGAIQRVQKQEHLLEKITEKFKSFFHHIEEILNKLSSIKKTLSNEEIKNEEDQEENRRRRDSIMPGERLMVGDSLVSKNGMYKFVFSATDGESYIYYRNGTLRAHMVNCEWPRPVPTTLHMFMNHTLEYYLDIWHGESANLACITILPMPCTLEDAECYVKLDNDGYLKYFTKIGEPAYTLL